MTPFTELSISVRDTDFTRSELIRLARPVQDLIKKVFECDPSVLEEFERETKRLGLETKETDLSAKDSHETVVRFGSLNAIEVKRLKERFAARDQK